MVNEYGCKFLFPAFGTPHFMGILFPYAHDNRPRGSVDTYDLCFNRRYILRFNFIISCLSLLRKGCNRV